MVIKLSTWNVNGLRTIKDLNKVLKDLDSHIVCLQETKLSRIQVDDSLAFIDGYSSQFVFPRLMAGYSGCATYCSEEARPFHAEGGLNDEANCSENWKETLNIHDEYGSNKNIVKELDSEGRCLITCHHIKVNEEEEPRKLYIFNVYFPRLDVDKAGRDEFKDRFNRLIEMKTNVFLQDPASHVIIAGDMNISHKQIDHCDPSPDFDECIYRKWLTSILNPDENNLRRHMIDSYRLLHPTTLEAFTCWNTQIRARATNFGTRIDYVLVDSELSQHIKSVSILSDYMGSDHCPVSIVLDNIEWIPSSDYPSISTKLWPEFGCKKQLRLTSFFNKSSSQASTQSQQPLKSPPKKVLAPSVDPSPKKAKATKIQTKIKKKQNQQSSIMAFMVLANKKIEVKNEEKDDKMDEDSVDDDRKMTNVCKVEVENEDTVEYTPKVGCESMDECKVEVENGASSESGDAVESKPTDESMNTEDQSTKNSNVTKERKLSSTKSKSKSPKEKPKVSLFDKIMAGPPKPPLCSGHKIPCVMNTCGKQGPNFRKRFWSCSLPKGDPNKPLITSCKYFRWIS